jgi:hypothetical protein
MVGASSVTAACIPVVPELEERKSVSVFVELGV